MASRAAALMASRSSWFDLGVFIVGVALVVQSAVVFVHGEDQIETVAVLCLPAIVLVARFPMILDNGKGTIEVGFDSSILMFLLCTQPPEQAILV